MYAWGMNEKDLNRFWAKVDKSAGEDGCWLWTSSDNGAGYGTFTWNGKSGLKAHRLSYELHNGHGSANGMCVCHKCDTRRCVNPKHLFLGTYADNNRDRQAKGRTVIPDNRGENCGTSKLKNEQVLQILAMEGKQKDIAAMFNVSVATVSMIKLRRIWKHL